MTTNHGSAEPDRWDGNPFAFDEHASSPRSRKRTDPETDPFAQRPAFSEAELSTASTHRFGVGSYLHRHSGSLFGGGLLGLAGVGLMVTMGILAVWGKISMAGAFSIALFGGFLAAVGLAVFGMAVVSFIRMPREVRARREELRLVGRKGEQTVSWEKISAIWREERVATQHGSVMHWSRTMTIALEDGTRIAFDHTLPDYELLAAKVQYFGSRHLLARRLAEWQAGKADFRPIVLWPDRITIEMGFKEDIFGWLRDNALAWDELKRWGVSNGNLVLEGQTARRVALGSIPNYPILLTLLETISQKSPATGEELANV